MKDAWIGHNSQDALIEIEVRLFNSLARFQTPRLEPCRLEMTLGSTIGDILSELGIPKSEVFLALCNGRDVTPDLDGGIRIDYVVDEGDVIALSGPVPYSWGYGSPVV